MTESKINVPGNHSKYLCIDVETTGQHQTKNEMICFAACIGNPRTGEIEDTFEGYILPRDKNDYVWEEKCKIEFWDKPENVEMKNKMLERVKKEGYSARHVMNNFGDWINNRQEVELDALVIITDTAGFDVGFMNHYLSDANLPSLNYIIGGKYRPTRDSSSFHMGVGMKLPIDGLWGAEKAALKRLEPDKDPVETLNKNPIPHDHDPLNDVKAMCWDIMLIHNKIKGANKK